MSTVQLELWGDVAAPSFTFPSLTCPWCHQTEPNEFVLRLNHGIQPPGEPGYNRPVEIGMCTRQDLRLSHVIYAIRVVQGAGEYGAGRCCMEAHHRSFRPDCALDQLRRFIALAVEAEVDVDGIPDLAAALGGAA